jgi:protease secretion system outer membrane protein
MRKNKLKNALLALALSNVFIFPVHAVNLLQAYQAALNNDASFKAAKAEKLAGKEYYDIGRANLLPTLQYSYSTNKNKGELTSPNLIGQLKTTDQDYRSTSKGFNLRQPLFNLASYASYYQGVAQVAYSDAIFDVKHSELMLRVLSAYSDAKYQDDQLSFFKAQRTAYLEQKLANEKMLLNGEGTRTDVLETQAKLDFAEAQVLEAQDNLQNALLALSVITGLDVKELDSLQDGFISLNSGETNFEVWRSVAAANNPEIQAAKQALEIAEQEVSKNRAAHAPRIDLVASSTQSVSESVASRGQDSSIRSLGVQIVIPVFSGGYVNASYKQTVARREKARAEMEGAQEKIFVDLRKHFNALTSSVIKIQALQKSVESSKLLVEATKQSVKGGVRVNLDLLNAYQQLAMSQRDLAAARYNYLISFLKLKIAAGNVSADDMKTVALHFTAAN